MTVSEFDLTEAKERIIKWLKADTNLFQQANPEGNQKTQELKLQEILFGVPEEEKWDGGVTPFAAVYNSDNLVVDDAFFGSVVDDELTSSYEKIQLEIAFVCSAATAELTERQIDYIHYHILKRMKQNVQIKNVDTDGTLIDGTELCETSKHMTTIALQAPNLRRRLFGYRMIFLIEKGT